MEPESDLSSTSSPSWSLVSVRSDVERVVDPDGVTLAGQISVTRDTKAEALTAAAVAVDGLKGQLTDLGGVALSASTVRHDLTWSTQRVTTMPEYEDDRKVRTGRIMAATSIQIGARKFDILGDLEALLAAMDSYRFFNAQWYVDADNPIWNEVRAEAIAEALRKGNAYASALGSALVSLDHVGDLGLLGRDPGPTLFRGQAAMGGGAGGATTPSLDPVPQRLAAQIEARFRVRPVVFDR